MSNNHRKRGVQAHKRRQDDRFERRAARNRIIIIVMAALMVLSLFAVPLTQWLSRFGDAAASEPARQDTAQADTEPAAADGAPELLIDPDTSYRATISTTAGDVTVELDPAGAPLATNNLVTLARDGYYDGIVFHRVIEGFMIQGGDPTGTGSGGPGYTFPDELAAAEEIVEEHGGYPRGTVAMANAGADTNGSQFFVIHQDYTLPPLYTVFGQVVDGMDVVDTIATTPTDAADRPVDPIEITTVTVQEG